MELPPGSRTQNLAAMDADERRGFWRALSQDDREKLTADMTPQQKELLLSLENPVAVVNGELMQGKLLRATYSERQLQEVMTDFWFNHFNVFIGKGADRYLVTSYERDVIRPHALGKFRDLLLATAKESGDALVSGQLAERGAELAGRRARNKNGKPAQGLNENYAREVMELHTLGVNGGYTQKDVTELARVLTGWTLEEPRRAEVLSSASRATSPETRPCWGGSSTRTVSARARQRWRCWPRSRHGALHLHQIGAALCERHAAAGAGGGDGEDFPRERWRHRGSARAPCCGAPEFWEKSEYRAKVKTPLEFTVSAIRATGAEVTSARRA